MRQTTLEPEFVDEIPENLEEGRLYISIRYRTASHLCACGCGTKVVTPIKPPKWHLTYDGETVSLWPSVGRWQLPCRSHYVIRKSRVVWAKPWTEKQIREGREEDAEDLRDYYHHRAKDAATESADLPQVQNESPRSRQWWWRRRGRS
jgi:uncharacterized protein DUF6527